MTSFNPELEHAERRLRAMCSAYEEQNEQFKIAIDALRRIVACDYRGPQPTEQLIAEQTLERISGA